MNMSFPANAGSEGSIASRLETVRTPGNAKPDRLNTIVSRSGSGLPMDSKVLRPITTTLPVVSFLNHLKSSGRCHGILFSAPMTRFSLMAAMALNRFTGRLSLHLRRHRHECRGEVVVKAFQDDLRNLGVAFRDDGEPAELAGRHQVGRGLAAGHLEWLHVIGNLFAVPEHGFLARSVGVMQGD